MAGSLSFWRNLFRRVEVERELDEELQATLAALIDDARAAGASADDARRAALIQLGGVESVKQQVREARRGALVETLLRDVRYAARVLRRNPLFTLTAAASLAIGIGATTAVFSVANGLLLRPAVGVANPGRLVDIVRRIPSRGPGVEQHSFPVVVDLRRQLTTVSDVFAYQLNMSSVGLRLHDRTVAAVVNIVTTNYFHALGVQAAAGRLFDAGDDEQNGASPVVVLSHRYWMRRFDGDRNIVGQTVRLNTVPLTVVGVAAEEFSGLSVVAPDLWLPVSMVAAVAPEGRGVQLTSRNIPWLSIGARLMPGVSRAQASAEIATVGAALQRSMPDTGPVGPPGTHDEDAAAFVWSAETASPIPYGLRGVVGAFVGLLMALVAIVLIIACANLAGVLLARATSRRREIAVRAAVGAARRRLICQLLTETTLLFALGGLAGLLMARLMTDALVSLLPRYQYEVAVSAPIDGRVVLFGLTISAIASVLSGLAPALHASRADVVTALKDDSQGPVDRLRLRNAFVIAQVAFSLLLVVTAGLLVRAFDNTLAIQRGFDARGVDVASIDVTTAGYTAASGRDLFRRLLDEVRRVPGIQHATLADHAPGPGVHSFGTVTVPGVTPRDRRGFVSAWTLIAPGYFETLGMPLLLGRDFGPGDREGSEPVAIVGKATADRLWPGRNPLGATLLIGQGMSPGATQGQLLKGVGGTALPPVPLQVVGVVGESSAGPQNGVEVVLYAPIEQRFIPRVTIIARRDPDGSSLAPAIAAAVSAVAPAVSPFDVDTLEKAGNGPVETQLRVAAAVAGGVGVIGLLLAAIGIYGVTAYAVTQRTREIGIRLSLGATRAEVIILVLKQGMRVVAVGATIGLLLGLGAGRLLAGRRFGIPQADPAVLVGAAALFVLIGLVACYAPVRRAARIRAMEALRYE
jgi:predicted permease